MRGIMNHPEVLTHDQIDRFAEHDVAKISDAMGKYGTLRSDVKPLSDDMRICGPAITVKTTPGTTSWVETLRDVLTAGDVVVVDGGELNDFLFADGTVYEALQAQGAAGLVVSGAVCDAERAKELRFPVFASGISLRRIDNRLRSTCVDQPLAISGMIVDPGDLIVGDSDGVVAVPSFDVDRVAALADAQLEKELHNKSILETGVSPRQYYGFNEKMAKWRDPAELR